MSDPTQPDPVLVLAKDLLLGSRVTAAASAVNVPCRLVRDPAKLAGQAGQRLIADLNLDGALQAATQWRAATGKPVVGFAAHVDAEVLRSARTAGLDKVVTRGQLVQMLEQLLTAPLGNG